MSRRLPISWGTEMVDGGAARFRLWAPARDRIGLACPDAGTVLSMEPRADGWFEIETDAVKVGQAYSFAIDAEMRVPDPAARAQVGDVNGPSRLVDPDSFQWRNTQWRGRPWHETVIYELHTGTFSPEGTFDAVRARLDHLAALGVTAIELMPVAQFAGNRGWGYDGTLLYAPHVAYGGPTALKALVDAAHERGLMVFLDVVYNHFGPEGNYLSLYAPQFFHPELKTPWGSAIAFEKNPVRRYFIDNALYWLGEYFIDGLRFDAIDQIRDVEDSHLLDALALEVRAKFPDRHIHLATEDDRNIVRHIERDPEGRVRLFTAEWNDDFHHATHVVATGESEGYYSEYAEDRLTKLARALSEGFIFQGQPSKFRGGRNRGVPSGHLPTTAFINFIQNHDQIGNRAFGERLTELASARAVDALLATLLLSPNTPLLYMGEEWGERRPFAFFTDFHGDLAAAVREGRRNEFASWSSFRDPETRDLIPDPNALSTFMDSKLDWEAAATEQGRARLALVQQLLATRRREIAPRIAATTGHGAKAEVTPAGLLSASWRLDDASTLTLIANLCERSLPVPAPLRQGLIGSSLIFESAPGADGLMRNGTIPEWSVVFRLMPAASP